MKISLCLYNKLDHKNQISEHHLKTNESKANHVYIKFNTLKHLIQTSIRYIFVT